MSLGYLAMRARLPLAVVLSVILALNIFTEETWSASPYSLYLPMVARSATPTPRTVEVVNVAQRSSLGYVYITGEVQNNTGAAVYLVKIAATFYNPDGSVAGANYSYAYYDWVPNGTRAPFLLLASPQAGWSRYELRTTWDTTSYFTYNHDFSLVNANSYWNGDLYYVVGEVRNDTAYTWQYVRPVVTIYDSSGRVIDTRYAYVSSTDLAPGQTSSFSTFFFRDNLLTMADYTVGVEGWR